MSIKVIESKDNKTFKDLVRLKKGDPENGLLLIEGEDLVKEAKETSSLLALLLPLHSSFPQFQDTLYLKEGLFRELASYQSLPKCMGIARKKMSQEYGDRVVYLDRIQDPGNCGTIIRTALSFHYTSLVLSKDSVSLYNSKVIQSSKGALFHLPIGRENLTYFADRGYHIYLTTLDGEDERNLKELETPFVLVFGNEGQGVRKEYLPLGKKIKIEMSGIDSLNVAVASGIFLYRFKKEL